MSWSRSASSADSRTEMTTPARSRRSTSIASSPSSMSSGPSCSFTVSVLSLYRSSCLAGDASSAGRFVTFALPWRRVPGGCRPPHLVYVGGSQRDREHTSAVRWTDHDDRGPVSSLVGQENRFSVKNLANLALAYAVARCFFGIPIVDLEIKYPHTHGHNPNTLYCSASRPG